MANVVALACALATLDPLPELPPAQVAFRWSEQCTAVRRQLISLREFVHSNGKPSWGPQKDGVLGVLGETAAFNLGIRYPRPWFAERIEALDRSSKVWRDVWTLRTGGSAAYLWESARKVAPLTHWRK